MSSQEIGLYKVGDTVVNFSKDAVTIIEIIESPPTDRKELGELMDQILKDHPHANFMAGSNIADDPRSASRVLPNAMYVIEH